MFVWNLSTIRFRAREWWSKWTSEFPIEFNIKLVHYALRAYQIILNLCFCLVSNILLPRGEQTLSHVPEKLLITKALSLLINKSNKAWLNTNLAKTPNLFTVEFQELLQIFWETYHFNSQEFFIFTCVHTLHLQKLGFLYETRFLRLKFSTAHLINSWVS